MSKSKEADTPKLCEQMTQGKPKHVLVLVLDLQIFKKWMRLYSQLSIPRHSLRDISTIVVSKAKLSLLIPPKSDQTYPTI